MKDINLELLHYLIVYGVLLAAWVPLMNYWQNNLLATAASGLIAFIIADQLTHKYLLGEKTLLEK